MKKRDILTFIGVFAGIGIILWGILINSQLKTFYDFASIVITIFGSFCAMLVNYPMSEFKKILKIMGASFRDINISGTEILQKTTELSRKARRDGLLSLENEIGELNDEYLKKGLQLVVDGMEPETIREVLELEIDEMERRHGKGAEMLKSWGGYAPAFGMIGTLIGLIQMLASLDDSNKLAAGMAAALITTFYGAVMAYLILNPMAANLTIKTQEEIAYREMMLEGILAIQSGLNPRVVEEKLIAYLPPKDREDYLKNFGYKAGVTNYE